MIAPPADADSSFDHRPGDDRSEPRAQPPIRKRKVRFRPTIAATNTRRRGETLCGLAAVGYNAERQSRSGLRLSRLDSGWNRPGSPDPVAVPSAPTSCLTHSCSAAALAAANLLAVATILHAPGKCDCIATRLHPTGATLCSRRRRFFGSAIRLCGVV